MSGRREYIRDVVVASSISFLLINVGPELNQSRGLVIEMRPDWIRNFFGTWAFNPLNQYLLKIGFLISITIYRLTACCLNGSVIRCRIRVRWSLSISVSVRFGSVIQ